MTVTQKAPQHTKPHSPNVLVSNWSYFGYWSSLIHLCEWKINLVTGHCVRVTACMLQWSLLNTSFSLLCASTEYFCHRYIDWRDIDNVLNLSKGLICGNISVWIKSRPRCWFIFQYLPAHNQELLILCGRWALYVALSKGTVRLRVMRTHCYSYGSFFLCHV